MDCYIYYIHNSRSSNSYYIIHKLYIYNFKLYTMHKIIYKIIMLMFTFKLFIHFLCILNKKKTKKNLNKITTKIFTFNTFNKWKFKLKKNGKQIQRNFRISCTHRLFLMIKKILKYKKNEIKKRQEL